MCWAYAEAGGSWRMLNSGNTALVSTIYRNYWAAFLIIFVFPPPNYRPHMCWVYAEADSSWRNRRKLNSAVASLISAIRSWEVGDGKTIVMWEAARNRPPISQLHMAELWALLVKFSSRQLPSASADTQHVWGRKLEDGKAKIITKQTKNPPKWQK